jgi:predicted DNA-binding transcriptional regulator AlpA
VLNVVSNTPTASSVVDPNEMLSPSEAAKLIRQQVTTLSAWRNLDKGPRYLKVGRSVFYLRSDLQAWLATRFHNPEAA